MIVRIFQKASENHSFPVSNSMFIVTKVHIFSIMVSIDSLWKNIRSLHRKCHSPKNSKRTVTTDWYRYPNSWFCVTTVLITTIAVLVEYFTLKVEDSIANYVFQCLVRTFDCPTIPECALDNDSPRGFNCFFVFITTDLISFIRVSMKSFFLIEKKIKQKISILFFVSEFW